VKPQAKCWVTGMKSAVGSGGVGLRLPQSLRSFAMTVLRGADGLVGGWV